ncbi:MAG: GNAT family N-acetyltransferase [Acidobacteriota bacterium]|nr:GNAT family N-acetyltransferase [Acidobacteriota bacterium]
MAKLETDRLILRMFTPDDLDALDSIFNKPDVMKYLGAQGAPMSRAETETALLSMIKHWERHGYGRWAVIFKQNQKLIGCAGLRNYEDDAELVFLIDQPYWGQGIATEIALACLNFGFEKHNFKKIIAFARPQNTASRNVMEKIGMRFVKEALVFGVFVVQYEFLQEDYYLSRSAQEG